MRAESGRAIPALRAYFLAVLAAMLAVTGWASVRTPLWAIPAPVGGHPWFVATLFDAYFGFLAFYLWIAYRETRWRSRVLWLAAVLLLGNIAMALYALAVLAGLGAGADARSVLLRGRPVPDWVPAGLLAGFAGLVLVTALS